MIVEIYEKESGKVVETREVGTTLSSFLVYWTSQCNREDYGWRVAKTPRSRNSWRGIVPSWASQAWR